MIGKALILASASEVATGAKVAQSREPSRMSVAEQNIGELPVSDRQVLEGVQICDDAVFMESKCRPSLSPTTCLPERVRLSAFEFRPRDSAGPLGAMRSIRRGRQNSPPMHKASGDLHPVVRLESADQEHDAETNKQTKVDTTDTGFG